MHIEPGLVQGAKIALSYGTSLLTLTIAAKSVTSFIRTDGIIGLMLRSVLTTGLVLSFFEVLPHSPVGVSEVHLILGSTLFLMFGLAPTAIGLAMGLLLQGLFFAPFDLPQYGMNVTTLLLPLFGMAWIARKTIPESTAYVDIKYSQTLRLSLMYQGGIITWVGFWALYGDGFTAQNLSSIASFSLAYLSVVLLEPLVDLAALAVAKRIGKTAVNVGVFQQRVLTS